MDNKKIGQFIATLRKEKNITQLQLSKELYVSDKAVSKWERGICMPDISLIDKLSKILEVSISEILKGEKMEKISKENSDNIVKESVTFFQKDYFNKKIIKTTIIVVPILIFLTFFFLVIGELNNGKLILSLWGNETEITLPNLTVFKTKKTIKAYLKAVQDYDYNAIGYLITENNRKSYLYDDFVEYKDYIKALENLQQEKIQLSKYKIVDCYKSHSFNKYGLSYYCEVDLTFKYKNQEYRKGVTLENNNGKIISSEVYLSDENQKYWTSEKNTGDNYNSIYNIPNEKIISNLEKILFKY